MTAGGIQTRTFVTARARATEEEEEAEPSAVDTGTNSKRPTRSVPELEAAELEAAELEACPSSKRAQARRSGHPTLPVSSERATRCAWARPEERVRHC
jgi:hypothetical protein